MKKLGFAAGVALLASTAIAQAGGIERTSQSVDILFEEGTLNTTPSASDVDPAPLEYEYRHHRKEAETTAADQHGERSEID